MNNSERLLLYALPRWAGVTALSIREPLSDMWLAGEEAGHHLDMPYDPNGYEKLRVELLKDFVKAPLRKAFGAGGNIRTVGDLDIAIAHTPQKPVPSTSAMLADLLPREELAMLLRGRLRGAPFTRQRIQGGEARKRRSTTSNPGRKKEGTRRRSTT